MPQSESIEPNNSDKLKKDIKENIDFFVSHLNIKELNILEEIAKKLAENYSGSYFEWKYK